MAEHCSNTIEVTPPSTTEIVVQESGTTAVEVQPPAANEVLVEPAPVFEVDITPPPVFEVLVGSFTITNIAGTAGGDRDVEITANGPYRVDTQIDGRHYNRSGRILTIGDVTLYREVAGSSGATTIDVNISGVTIYTTQANRPSIAAASGNDQFSQGGQPDITSWPPDTYLTVDIDTVEVGRRANLRVVVTTS